MSESAAPVPSPGRAVDAPVPTGDRLAAAYLLGIADDAMVFAQRLGEWLTNAPQIEEDMALANVSLDLLGQARGLYPHIGELDGSGRSEDDFAMLRDERGWRNVHLVEQERGDFGFEMARLLWFSAYQNQLYGLVAAGSADETFRAVGEKAAKEVQYHADHARQWVLRLGDGTEDSRRRMQAALERVAPYVDELFDDDPVSVAAAEAGLGRRPSLLRDDVVRSVQRIVEAATLTLPEPPTWRSRGGRQGVHSAPMGYLLAEMQHLARSHPGATW
ncbi:MAG: 1,2-phenylacetyl-CoA epoxidase subunit PaaC [Lapillicoccus sp.]